MNLFKFLVGAATITVGACAVAGKVHRDKQRQEELDEFLCPDIDEPIEKEIQPSVSPLKNMESDIMGFKEAEEEILPVTLTYSFDSKEAAKQFQTEIAENGLTSSYDDEDKLVDVIYHEGVNESDLKILSNTLVNACTNTSAEYKGFHFNKLWLEGAQAILIWYNSSVYGGGYVMEAIEVSHLTFSYDGKNDILKDVSFSIPKGSYTTIIGHNGSGKSTMAKLIIGLLEAKKGKIQILGQELNEESVYELRSHIGIVFQNPDNQFIGSTVADDIAFGLENHCVEQEKMQGIIEDVAGRVGMTDFLSAEPTKLSGGQKQRVAIAGILAIEPDIIIFDESTSMLDPQGKASINAQIRKLHEEKNITILSITHDMEEVAQSENVIVLENGEIAMQGTPMDIFKQEDKLAKMQLDIPFGLKISKELKKRGIFKENVCRLDEVVEKLCRLK